MSSATAVKVSGVTFAERASAAPKPARTTPVVAPARLRLVPSDQAMSLRSAYYVAAILMGLGLVALLVLNVSLSSTTRDLSRESAQLRVAKQEREQLQEQLLARQATQNLARAAKKLGMVPAPATAFIAVESGEITGTTAVAKPTPVKPIPVKSKVTDKPATDKPATDKPAKPATGQEALSKPAKPAQP